MFYAKRWTYGSVAGSDGEWGPFTSTHEAQEKIKAELRSEINERLAERPSWALAQAPDAEREIARLWALLLAYTSAADSKAEGFEPAAQVRASGRTMIDGLAFGVYGTSRVTEDELAKLDAVTLRLIINGKRGNDLDPEAKQKAQAELDRRVGHPDYPESAIRSATPEEKLASHNRRIRARANRVLADAPDLDGMFGREDEEGSL